MKGNNSQCMLCTLLLLIAVMTSSRAEPVVSRLEYGADVIESSDVTSGDDVIDMRQVVDELEEKQAMDTTESTDDVESLAKTLDESLTKMQKQEEGGVKHKGHHQKHHNPCFFKHCYVGEKCMVNKISGKAECVCKKHCKPNHKPLCGTDGNFYDNHCEMSRAACIQKRDIFDARHKDCFYKKYNCSKDELQLAKDEFLAHYLTSAKSEMNKKGEEGDDLTSDEVESPDFQSISEEIYYAAEENLKAGPAKHASRGSHNSDIMYSDIVTNDVRGDDVINFFKYLDLDDDGLVGTEELYEISILEPGEEDLLRTRCNLFHLHHEADVDEDNAVDIHEFLHLYEITVVELPDEDRNVTFTSLSGAATTLQCGISGEDEPEWRHLGMDLYSLNLTQVKVNGTELMFDATYPHHSGVYSCHARKKAGKIFQTINLSVYVPPTVQTYLHESTVIEGNSFTILCDVDGVPHPTITWLKDGEEIIGDRDQYLILNNGTEFHVNEARLSDSGAYSCQAENVVEIAEHISTVLVQDELTAPNQLGYTEVQEGSYYVFHQYGINIIDPASCITQQKLNAFEMIPGLLKQNALCRRSSVEGRHECGWSDAVAVGPRYVYAAQPYENRLVVIDIQTQKVAEVITTDFLPVKLTYVKSSDQLFVLCWTDVTRQRSKLQVVYAASMHGFHSAAHLGDMGLPMYAYDFFVPPENLLNKRSRHGFVIQEEQQVVFILNLETLEYEPELINLEPFNCFPIRLSYLPTGGQLLIQCDPGYSSPQVLIYEYSSKHVIHWNTENPYDAVFVAPDGLQAVFLYHEDQKIKVFNVSTIGELNEPVEIHSNFGVSSIAFTKRLQGANGYLVHMASSNQDDVMSIDTSSGEIDVINDLFGSNEAKSKPFWSNNHRILTASAWYDRHLVTAGDDGVDIIDIDMNEINCRFKDIERTTAITWADGRT